MMVRRRSEEFSLDQARGDGFIWTTWNLSPTRERFS